MFENWIPNVIALLILNVFTQTFSMYFSYTDMHFFPSEYSWYKQNWTALVEMAFIADVSAFLTH